MNKFLILSLFLISFNVSAEFWKAPSESSRTTANPVISKTKFQRIIKNMGINFQFLAQNFGEKLFTYGDWNDPSYDSALARRWDSAQVIVFRGMAHRREIDPDALVLILCHELGHLYGGEPLKPNRHYISAEGQADYFATNFCLRNALHLLSPNNIEKRALKAIHSVGKFLANNWGHSHPSEETPDPSVVGKTNLEYPIPQCRFDTYIAGLRGKPRPACWFAKSN